MAFVGARNISYHSRDWGEGNAMKSVGELIKTFLVLALRILAVAAAALSAALAEGAAAWRRRDIPTIPFLLRPLATHGDAKTQFAVARTLDEGRGGESGAAEAVKWYSLAAEQGSVEAMNALGVMYGAGRGVPQDYEASRACFQKAAELGDAKAQNNLGIIFDNGQGVEQDFAEAAKWYAMAAKQGHAEAQFLLGHMHLKGQGVAEDRVQAHKWFNLAASQGIEAAGKSRDIVSRDMTPEQIAEAQQQAREWSPK